TKKAFPLATKEKNIPTLNSLFSIRPNHSTIDQLHRVFGTLSSSLEKKSYCTAVFLDLSQAFNGV
ncbi:Uncharacterized protein FWK35_00016586, partial [Aphis craccivora]